jgi:hypothetical protein
MFPEEPLCFKYSTSIVDPDFGIAPKLEFPK